MLNTSLWVYWFTVEQKWYTHNCVWTSAFCCSCSPWVGECREQAGLLAVALVDEGDEMMQEEQGENGQQRRVRLVGAGAHWFMIAFSFPQSSWSWWAWSSSLQTRRSAHDPSSGTSLHPGEKKPQFKSPWHIVCISFIFTWFSYRELKQKYKFLSLLYEKWESTFEMCTLLWLLSPYRPIILTRWQFLYQKAPL